MVTRAERSVGAESVAPAGAGSRAALAGVVSVDAWLTTTHLLVGLWAGLLCFVPIVVLLSLSLGLTPVFLVGIPLLGITASHCGCPGCWGGWSGAGSG